MPYTNEHAARLHDPDGYERFRRMINQGGAGIDFIIGFKRGGGSEVQAIRFAKSKFTAAEAKKWLADHDHKAISFEPAAEGSNNSELDFEAVSPDLAQGSAIEGEVEIAVAGKYPQGDLTPEIFDELVATFNPAVHEPPHVIGHITPEHNDRPAYGWIAGLRRVGDRLLAKSKQIAKDLDDLVRSGRFKKRSIGIRVLEDGRRYLHHLAWLGSMVPACKGLKDVYLDYLDAGRQEDFEIEIDNSNSNKGDLSMKTYTEEEMRNETARIERETRDKVKAELETDFADRLKTAETAARADERKKVEKEFSDASVETTRAANYRRDVDSLLKKAIDEKKIVSAQVEPLRAILYAMDKTAELVYSEGEGDKKVERKEKALDAAKRIIESYTDKLGGNVEDPANAGARGGQDANYAEDKAAAWKLSKDEGITFGQALKKVQAKRAGASK
jgi:hypothetical protein